MAKNSKIEWTDHTFNPWIGCEKVSAGCANCYAEALNNRMGWAEWGPDGTRKRTSESNWKKPYKWNKENWVECEHCHWRGPDTALSRLTGEDLDLPICPECYGNVKPTRQRVFCASLGDVFESRSVLIGWRKELLALIDKTQNLDWLLLTKRPENVIPMLEEATHYNLSATALLEHMSNIWIGTSVENQEMADMRVPALMKIPAAKRFLSIEPLLDVVDIGLFGTVPKDISQSYKLVYEMIDLVIVGGESGPKARPMNPNWVRIIRDQCIESATPFFFKQWGGRNKKKAGRLLDDREWNEMPQ